MNGEVTLYNHLLADSNVTDLLSLSGTAPMIAVGVKEPDTWGVSDSTISIYSAAPVDYRMEYFDNTVTVNCRANTEPVAKAIALAVIGSANRKEIDSEGRFYCQMLPPIQPLDDADSYNVPVEINIKGQTTLN